MAEILNHLGTNDVVVFTPSSTEDMFEVITHLKTQPAIICLSNAEKVLKQRIIDLAFGAATALDMGICMVDKNNLLIIKR